MEQDKTIKTIKAVHEMLTAESNGTFADFLATLDEWANQMPDCNKREFNHKVDEARLWLKSLTERYDTPEELKNVVGVLNEVVRYFYL